MSLNEINLEKKFNGLTNSQDAIQSLSLWILHHKNHYKRIIQIWFNCFEKAKMSHRLTLLYLANDVIQHSKKKSIVLYLDGFNEVLKEATLLMRDDKIKGNVERVFNIWLDRNVYTPEFIGDLKLALNNSDEIDSVTNKIIAEFNVMEFVNKIRRMKKTDSNTRTKVDYLSQFKIEALTGEFLNQLKDKSHGEQITNDVDNTIKALEVAIEALEKDISTRKDLIEAMKKGEIFYETQQKESRIVANAYKNFGAKAKSVKKKLSEWKTSLPSPLPSPCADAPSPTNSEDGLHLPGLDHALHGMTSFTGLSAEMSNQPSLSLDERLASMQNEPNKLGTNSSSMLPSALQIALQMAGGDRWVTQNAQLHRQSYLNQQMLQPPPPPPPPPPLPSSNRNYLAQPTQYDYEFMMNLGKNMNNGSNELYEAGSSNIQPIQAVISSRSDTSLNQLNQMETLAQQASLLSYPSYNPNPENFEPADMDLGNSDDEDTNRSHSQQRVLKVIDTRRTGQQLPDYQNQTNSKLNINDNAYNHHMGSSNNLKSVARIPSSHQPHHHVPSNDDLGRWRGARSTIINTGHYQSSDNSYSPSNPNNRNWRPMSSQQRNNRRGSFRQPY